MRIFGLLLLLPLAMAAQAPAPATPAASAGGGYVGSNVCKGCHPDVWMNFPRNPHFKSIAMNAEAEHKGCEGCHGPGAAHVKAGGGKKTIPFAFSLLTSSQALDRCLTCHAKDISRANIRRSVHTDADVVCNNCHSIHKSQTPKFLLAKVQKDLCYQCHATVRAQFDMPVKHRVNEGVVQCSDCHNPHGTFSTSWRMGTRPRQVDQTAGSEEPCIKCHQDKRGPFVFEHAAVRVDGCESCHSPHGSMNSKLLRRPAVFTVCLECHNGAGGAVNSFGRSSAGIPGQSSAHNMLDPRFQNCTTCHVRIHGSNSDANLLR